MPPEVGTRFPDKSFYVDPVRVEEYVTALGVEPEHGYQPGIGAAVPPGFFMYVTTYGADEVHAALGFDMLRTVYSGSDTEHLAPVRVGDRLVVRPRLTALHEKQGRSGRLTFAELTTEYLRQDGTVVVRERSNTVEKG